jgi:hypothetical protein
MTRRLAFSILAILAASLVAGCNAARTPQPVALAPREAASRPAPSDFKLPEGAGCANAIARYRAIMDNDHATGHVNQGVYDQIQGEIAEAEQACSAGQDGRAQSLVHASKSRHGYPG